MFVIEDHELVSEALQHFIERDPSLELAGVAATADDGLMGVARTRPDVALLDVYLPDGNGIVVCRELKSSYSDIKCVVLTGAGNEPRMAAILAGADGYVGKEVGFGEVARTIAKVMRGERAIGEVPGSIAELIDRSPRTGRPRLKPQEVGLLELIAEGMTNREIANELHLAEQTIKNYVSRLLSKLGLERRSQAAAFAVKSGFTRGD